MENADGGGRGGQSSLFSPRNWRVRRGQSSLFPPPKTPPQQSQARPPPCCCTDPDAPPSQQRFVHSFAIAASSAWMSVFMVLSVSSPIFEMRKVVPLILP